MVSERLARTLARIDEANAEDPKGEELVYGQRMTAWLERLVPDAAETVRIAARAQHIRRHQIPRDSYPMDRVGYLKWRSALYDHHADQAEAILREEGYDDESIARVRKMLRKKQMRDDPDVQTIEDVACLVFLEHYFPAFAEQHDDDKLVDIVRKTWKKMSSRAREAAGGIALPERLRQIVGRAVAAA